MGGFHLLEPVKALIDESYSEMPWSESGVRV